MMGGIVTRIKRIKMRHDIVVEKPEIETQFRKLESMEGFC
jgi:hypothetical protein